MQLALLISLALGAQSDSKPVVAPVPVVAKQIDFATQIQPIFKARCYECHGPDAQESGLRLDVRRRALEGGDSGPLFAKGKSETSRLIERVISKDADHRMPPEGDPLSKEQVDSLKRWIDSGADWPDDGKQLPRKQSDHWSFQPPKHHPLPTVTNSAWVRNDVDRFVLAKLEANGLAPSPEAERTTVMRRLFLDLVGLPPTPDEMDAFLNDTKPGAYARLVDRLLESPHFGERWGRHWLDLARYADSNGYERDDVRPNAWRYRDWVIDALNDDMPYDRFVIAQLAGDLLPAPTDANRIATGFHRMTIKNTESGINKEDYRNREVVDRVNTTGTVFLGLTIGCCQCHSHKYDPISQREYYRFYAFFNNLAEQDVDIEGTPAEQAAYQLARQAHEDKAKLLKARQKLLAAVAKEGIDVWKRKAQAENESAERQVIALKAVHSLGAEAWHAQLTADVRQELNLPKNVAAVLEVPEAKRDEQARTVLEKYYASLDESMTKAAARVLSLEERLAVLDDPAETRAALLVDESARTEQQARTVAQFERTATPRNDDLRKSIRMLSVEGRYLPKPYLMAAVENQKKRRETHVLIRGDFKQKGALVEPASFEILPKLAIRDKAADRLDLARWIVDSANPLTARVAVNHVWKHLFGGGLVPTTDDFGTQGEPPSHPKLLDRLALKFQENGWSRKKLIHYIVSSATYRQSSRLRPELKEKDPLNRLLARQSRFRIEGEVVRDLFLAAGGLLHREIGGRTIRPRVDDSIAALSYKYNLVWPVSDKPDRYRRGMYIHFKRSNPYPSLITFDVPEGSLCTAERNRSNTPLQALTTLNDPVFVECAQALGRRILTEGPADVKGRVQFAGRVCLSRPLSAGEVSALSSLYLAEKEAYQQSPEAAKAFVGEYAANEHPVFETAAWTAVARVLMNLDQFVTRE